jgi:hypothetical protein
VVRVKRSYAGHYLKPLLEAQAQAAVEAVPVKKGRWKVEA